MKRILVALGLLALSLVPAFGQQTKAQLNTEVSTNFPDNTTGAITPAILRTTVNDIIASFQQAPAVNPQTGTTYAIVVGDYGKLVTFSNTNPVAVTIPQATTNFATFNVYVRNIGSGAVTITPTTSTINGSASITLNTNDADQIISDGANYQTLTYGGAVTGLANPTATIAKTAVNGSATTAMRSDAAPALPGGVWSNTRLAKTADYTAVSSDCGDTLALGGSAFFTLTLSAASGYDSRCVFVVVNEDTGRGKLIAASGVTNFVLWPGQTATIYNDNNVWQVNRPNRYKQPSPTTFNVSTTGSDSNNDCLGTGTGACASVQGAVSLICGNMDANQQAIIVSIAAGTYTGGTQLCPVPGQARGGNPGSDLRITGDTTTPTNVVLTVASSCTIRAGSSDIEWFIEGVTLGTTGSGGISVCADAGSWLRFGKFQANSNSSGVAMQVANKATIELTGNVTVNTGSGGSFAFSNAQSFFLTLPITVTLSGSPTFSIGFVNCDSMSLQAWSGVTFSGATGAGSPRISAANGCGILTGSSGSTTFFPGDSFTAPVNPAWYN